MNQPTLDFSRPVAAARTLDPASSHQAAVRVEASGKAQRQRDQLLDAVKRRPGMTAAELAVFTSMSPFDANRRLPDLRLAGLVRNGEPRVCYVRRSPCSTWWPSEPKATAP